MLTLPAPVILHKMLTSAQDAYLIALLKEWLLSVMPCGFRHSMVQ